MIKMIGMIVVVAIGVTTTPQDAAAFGPEDGTCMTCRSTMYPYDETTSTGDVLRLAE